MKSSGPWDLRGLNSGVREAAREAARKSGMSVGEWLNNVIEWGDQKDRPPGLTEFDHKPAEPALDVCPDHSQQHDRAHEPDRPELERRRDKEGGDHTDRQRGNRDRHYEREMARVREEAQASAAALEAENAKVREEARLRDEARQTRLNEQVQEAARICREFGELYGRLGRLMSELEDLSRTKVVQRQLAPENTRQQQPPPIPLEHILPLNGAPEPRLRWGAG